MLVLAFDTSTAQVSVAFGDGGAVMGSVLFRLIVALAQARADFVVIKRALARVTSGR